MLESLKRRLHTSEKYELNMWRFIFSFVSLLVDLGSRGLWVEDMSGSNFLVDSKFQVFLVDLDSLQSIDTAKVTCSDKCPAVVNQRLWKPSSLNHKVSKCNWENK